MNFIICFLAFFFSNTFFSNNNGYNKNGYYLYRKIFLNEDPYAQQKNPNTYINKQKDQKIIRIQTPTKTHGIFNNLNNPTFEKKRDFSAGDLKIEKIKIKIFEDQPNDKGKNFLIPKKEIKIEKPKNKFFLNYEKEFPANNPNIKKDPVPANTIINNEKIEKIKKLIEERNKKVDAEVQTSEIKEKEKEKKELVFSSDENEKLNDKDLSYFRLTESINIKTFDAQNELIELYNLKKKESENKPIKSPKKETKVYKFFANFKDK